MSRVLVLVVVVAMRHHIEGVCKPWSPATEAFRALLARFVAQTGSRDLADAEMSREQARLAAVQRLELAVQQRLDLAQQRLDRAQEALRDAQRRRLRPGARRRVLDQGMPRVVDGQVFEAVNEQLRRES